MNKFINSKSSGFTIVELLIVIVVIGILAAITIVSYTGITSQANANAAKSNAQAVLDAAVQYYNLSGSYPAVASGTLTMPASNGVTISVPTGVTVQTANVTNSSGNSVVQYDATTAGTGACAWYYPTGGALSYVTVGVAASTQSTQGTCS